MSPADSSTEPTELIYEPSPSWAPILVAAGIAMLAAASWMGWIMAVIGAFILLLGAGSWWRRSSDEYSRMRRDQRTDTAVIPAEPVKRR